MMFFPHPACSYFPLCHLQRDGQAQDKKQGTLRVGWNTCLFFFFTILTLQSLLACFTKWRKPCIDNIHICVLKVLCSHLCQQAKLFGSKLSNKPHIHFTAFNKRALDACKEKLKLLGSFRTWAGIIQPGVTLYHDYKDAGEKNWKLQLILSRIFGLNWA